MDPPERKILNVVDLHFSQCGEPTCEGDNVIHCVADPQVMEMQATNSPVSYGCLTVDEE